MELSGLIFVALALVWAVVLIPKALKHHDELAEHRSVEGSDDARVLARREQVRGSQARLVVGPAVSTVVAPKPAPKAPAQPVAESAPDRATRVASAHRSAAREAARRRRRILAFLLVLTVLVSAVAAVGYLQLWAPAVPAAVTFGYLVLARVLVRREHARWARLVADLRRRAQPAEQAAAQVGEQAPVEAAPQRNEQGVAMVSGLDDTSSFPMGLLADPIAAAAPVAVNGSLWDPLPVTLPTYVSKPRATRSVRTIDLNAPGVSSSGRDAAASALVAEAATAAAPEDPEQRAVGS